MTDENNATETVGPPRPTVARELLEEMLARMGFDAEVAIVDEEDRTILSIDGEDSETLIGKKGETLDAIQFVLTRMLARRAGTGRAVVVDCGGYRQRRSQALEELAHKLCEKATRTGKIVAVNPMSAHDRRVIHMALKEVPGVTTRSEGEGPSRRLLIVPDPE